MKRISLALFCITLAALFSAPRSRAIELSLEENRAERGSAGFVDMQRLFKASPDAARAKEGLEELVRQAEELVNAKKAELLHLRQELGTLKIERDELAKSTPTVVVPVPAPVAPPTPALAPALAPAPQMPTIVETLKPSSVAVDTSPVTAAPLPANLPGFTGSLTSPLNPTRDRATQPPVAVSTPAAPASASAPTPPIAVTPSTAPVATTGPTLAQRLLELDGRIVARQGEIDRLQGALDRERLGAEHTLLDAEGRKTDQVLARLYRAISEVAKREGVSVVVDKSATLYGHPAVDLTDKVLKQLRGVVPAQ